MNNFTTGNKTVDEIGQMHFEGNIIPHTWYGHLRLESGKPDLNSLILLSEIVYWHRPTYIKDERTGALKGMKKRFAADLLQRSYDSFADQFGLTKRQVKDAFFRMEQLGILTRHFRTVQTESTKLGNVLFIELHTKKLAAMTFEMVPYDVKTSEGYDVKTSEVSHSNVIGVTLKRQTNTESTTKSTTKKNNNNNSVGETRPEDQKTEKPKSQKAKTENQKPEDLVTDQTVIDFFQNNFGIMSPYVTECITSELKEAGPELLLAALKVVAKGYSDPNFRLVEGVLRKWRNAGVKTIEEARAFETSFHNKQAARQQKQRSFNGKPLREEQLPSWVEEHKQESAAKEAVSPKETSLPKETSSQKEAPAVSSLLEFANDQERELFATGDKETKDMLLSFFQLRQDKQIEREQKVQADLQERKNG